MVSFTKDHALKAIVDDISSATQHGAAGER
jgi:hypothetical protein